ncbi:MAG: proton-conducting transporter membrane subunit [Anaerolineae bacterium]|nr:proton-conducting transporter membrane subunit [Anaerolineae bacterium]
MNTDLSVLLPLLIVVPLLAAILTFLLPRLGFVLALFSAALTVGLTLAALIALDAGPLRHAVGGWRAPLGIDLVMDGLSALMVGLTALISLFITLYAHGYFQPSSKDDKAEAHRWAFFWPLWLFLWSSLNALFLSADVFNLYVTLELLGFSAVALTALSGKPAVLKAAMRYLLVSLSGSLLYLMGVVFLYGGFGVLDIARLGLAAEAGPALAASAALISAGLMMKSALFPLHFWLPPAHANAAAPISALLSALVVKGSLYILLRLWLEVFYPLADTFVPQVISWLGAGAALWGSIQAIRQARLKLLIAYSTVAQLGYMFLPLPLLLLNRDDSTALAGIVFFVLAHAVAKSAAFLSAGNILHAVGDDRVVNLNGLMGSQPLTVTALGLAGISLVALPPSGGFLGKWLLLDSAIAQDYWGLVAIILMGGLLAAIYIIRVVARFFREPSADGVTSLQPVPLSMSLPTLSLGILAIALGFVGATLMNILEVGAPWTLRGGS